MYYKDTKEKAEEVRKRFRGGEEHKEIQKALDISRATYYKYWKILGGIQNKDQELHWRNKK